MERKIKNQKGITLVALVITIIVMLILVAVSVTVAINGGLFTQAKEAGNSWEDKSAEEAAGNIINVDNQIVNIDSAINTLKDRPKTPGTNTEIPGDTQTPTTISFTINGIAHQMPAESTWADWIEGKSGWQEDPTSGLIVSYEDAPIGEAFYIYWPDANGTADQTKPVSGNEFIEEGVGYIIPPIIF